MKWKIDNCKVSKDLIDLYLDGRISDSDRQFVEKHLLECENCSSYVQFHSELKSLFQSEEMKPSSNPYLYSNLMNRVDGISSKPQLSGLKMAFTGSIVAILALAVTYPLFNQDEKSDPVKHSSGLVGASPQTHYLLSDLTESDILFFWKEDALPIDQNRNEYVVLDRKQNNQPSLVFTGNSCKDCGDLNVIKSVSGKMNLTRETISGIDKIVSEYSEKIRSSLLIDRSGQLLINADVFEINAKLASAFKKAVTPENFNDFRNQVFASFGKNTSKVYSSFSIDLPHKSDKVSISEMNQTQYSLISVDPFTTRSLRQSFPKLGRIIAPDFEAQSVVSYKIVSKNEVLYASHVKTKEESLVKTPLHPEEKPMSILEANRLMTAMKSGMSPDEIIAYKAEFEKYLEDYSKLSQEVRTQYSGKENEEGFKVYIPQSERINVVGFGNEPQKSSRKQRKSSATISIDHP